MTNEKNYLDYEVDLGSKRKVYQINRLNCYEKQEETGQASARGSVEWQHYKIQEMKPVRLHQD